MPQSQNFDGMGSSGTATLPAGFRVSNTTVYSGGTTATTQAAGTSGTGILTSSSGGGTYNFANGVTASATDRALGFLTSGSFASPRSIMVELQNTTGATITQLSVTFDYEKYRSGSRAFDWTFFSGTDGSTWTPQTTGDQAYAADANNMTISNPPTTISKTVTITGLSIPNGGFYYLRWTFTGVGGSTNGQGIGIDNFSVTATGPLNTYYQDSDMDTYGNPLVTTMAASPPAGYVSDNTDCNDGNGAVNPGATEVCNGIDDDCDLGIDEGVQSTFYEDFDNDTYGDPNSFTMDCAAPVGYVSNDDDCDDFNSALNPTTVWYLDADNDNYYTGTGITQCTSPGAGYEYTGLTGGNDCNDGSAAINPGATEACNSIDDNCDLTIDEGCNPGAALNFNETDQVTAALPAVFSNIAANDFTMETWVKLSATGDFSRIAFAQLSTTNFTTIAKGGANNIYFYVVANGTNYSFATNNTLTVGEWTHVAVRWIAATQTRQVLFNGVVQAGVNGGSSTTATNNVFSLGSRTDGAQPLNGELDEFRIWDKALSDTEIAAGMNCETTGSQPNLVLSYHFNQGIAGGNNAGVTTLTDDSGNANHGTLNTFALTGASSNWVAPGGVVTGTTCTCTPVTWYRDMDNDTYGDPAVTQSSCTQPAGYVADNTDCKDTDAAVHPTAVGICDGCDQDCDGIAGDDVAPIACGLPSPANCAGLQTCVPQPVPFPGACLPGGSTLSPCNNSPQPEVCDGIDNNCDGMVDNGIPPVPCVPPGTPPLVYGGTSQCQQGTMTCGGVCVGFVGPSAETCDGVDNDCDGTVDEGVVVTWYRDMDMDGFGNPAVTQSSCTQPVGYVANNTDCDDTNAAIHPNTVWYLDADNDNYYTGSGITQCTSPGTGYRYTGLTAGGDCTDSNAAINPGAPEICNGVDDNCNIVIDEGVQTLYYRDMDMDGFGNPSSVQSACTQPAGYVTNNTDCNDNNALEKPGQVWYKDSDNDNYSDGTTLTQCLRPAGYKAASELTATTGDCNDNNAAIKPGATEVCDGIDNNCNGATDEGLQTTYYRDMDGDGFGNPSVTQSACTQPSGYVTNNTDCNDNSALEKPGQVWYKDTDNDGYGETGAATITQCARPTGYKAAIELTSTTGDCNDNNAAIKPGATEVCDGVDNNCNGSTDEGMSTYTYYLDQDNDGYGNPAVTQTSCSPTPPAGYVTNNTDCNDNSAAVNPAAAEICDDLDNNCNGQTDETHAISNPWSNSNVGTGVNGAASSTCNANNSEVFNVEANGFSTSSSDNLHLVYLAFCGNGEIKARVLSTSSGGWAGITLRESLAAGSKKVALKTQLTSIIRREIRSTTNGAASILNYNRPGHTWLRLTRSGSTFVGYTSVDGVTWDFAFSAMVPMTGCIYAGLFAESINTNVKTTASFDQVSVFGETLPPTLSANTTPVVERNDLNVSVYPNPGNGDMTLSVAGAPEHENLQLEVVDALGRVVHKAALPEGTAFTYPLDLRSEPAGVYHLRIRSENGVENTQRIVIQ